MSLKQYLIFFLLLCATHVLQAQREIVQPHWRVLAEGDNPAWASPDLDDSNWDPEGATRSTHNFWVRFKVYYDPDAHSFKNTGMHIISLGSYDLYWNGILLESNGVVGNSKESEIPGQFLSQVLVPDSLLTKGEHLIAFRVSNHHLPPLGLFSWNTFYLEEYKATVKSDLVITAWIFILAGTYLMAALYYLFIFLLRTREKEALIFSSMCFLFFALILTEYVKFLYAYPYNFQLIRLQGVFILTLLITFLTPLFFLQFFKIPRTRLIGGVILSLLVLVSIIFLPLADLASQGMSLIMWISSLAIAVYASYKEKKDSWVILLAILSSGAVVVLHNLSFRFLLYSYDITLFVSFSILVLSMMYVLARRAQEQKSAYEASLLLSSRLQNELLKKNIQPHFIMNTLTSLMEWIEESPKESIKFIEALSREFEIVSDIAEEKLIPIEQEISLCKYHIEIMKFRKEVDYGFSCENIPEGETIPPAIFHTLIENGISHSMPHKPVNMVLRYKETDTYKSYQLRTYAENRKKTHTKDGTGLKYIKSRLKENYGDAWKLDSHASSDGWVTDLFLYKKNK